jgi:aminopeptidase N
MAHEPAGAPWRVEHIELQIELGADRCVVTNRSRYVRTAAPAGPLVLDGVGLETMSVEIETDDDSRPATSPEPVGTQLVVDLGDDVVGAIRTVVTVTASRPGGPADKGFTLHEGIIATNLEPQGFRRITWSQDQPDSRATFDVTLIGDVATAPVVLAAGERVATGNLDDGVRHMARFVDPVAKAPYLFAVVAGDLSVRSLVHTTSSGRSISLVVAAPPHLIGGAGYALTTLDEMMRFDEVVTGFEHDLETLTYVALPGYPDATEYQGLMFFNPSLLVVDERGHVDDDLVLVMLNVAHEYGHHARGNRVAVASWQQLALKEGLTVLTAQNDFRRHVLGPAARILEVLDLRRLQHPEELTIGAPVVRDVVADPSQLYTRTTYLKGAELFEMFRTVLGADVWADVLRAFLARHDRAAASVSDFVTAARGAATDASVIDGVARWFTLAGRPVVTVERRKSSDDTTIVSIARADGLADDPRVSIPLRLGFVGLDGTPVPVVDASARVSDEHVVVIDGDALDVVFRHDRPFVLAPSRGWSAPVDLVAPMAPDHLAVLARHDPDPTMRWWAVQELMTAVVDAYRHRDITVADELVHDVLGPVLLDACTSDTDPLLLGQLLAVPDEYSLGDRDDIVDVDGVSRGLGALRLRLGTHLHDQLLAVVERSGIGETGGDDGADIARRSVIEPALALLLATGSSVAIDVALHELASPVPTRALRALTQLLHLDDATLATSARGVTAAEIVQRFADRWGHVPGLVDRGVRAETGSRRADTIERVASIVASERYDRTDRGRVMAVWFPFATRNRAVFHDPSGAGYRVFVDELTVLLASDPGTVVRLVGDLLQFRRFDDERSRLMRIELERLAATPGLPDFAVGILRHLLDSP